MAKLIYLDSNDFSDLSAPESRLSPENKTILAALRDAKLSGRAEFYYSAIHISEAVHQAMNHKSASVARAKLMQELCGTNILRFPTEIFRLELDKALSAQGSAKLSRQEIHSQKGEWLGFEVGTAHLNNARAGAKEALKEATQHLPRRDRKRIISQLKFSKASAKPRWKEIFDNAGPEPVNEFPFSLMPRDTSLRWLIGEISDQDFTNCLMKILCDPFLLFDQIIDRTKERETLYKIIRKEGAEWTQKMMLRMEPILPYLSMAVQAGELEYAVDKINKALTIDDAAMMAVKTYPSNPPPDIDPQAALSIVERCPSLSLFLSMLKRYFQKILEANISRLKIGKVEASGGKPSDFADFMHFIYAPYFDILRCDAHFGALLHQETSVSSRIVEKRGRLISLL